MWEYSTLELPNPQDAGASLPEKAPLSLAAGIDAPQVVFRVEKYYYETSE
jgi:hypothetical protein